MAGALSQALRKYDWAKEETILDITNGQPDSETAVERVIIEATQRMGRDEELSISFIQIGKMRDLKKLDSALVQAGARFYSVDTKCIHQMKGMAVPELVMKFITS